MIAGFVLRLAATSAIVALFGHAVPAIAGEPASSASFEVLRPLGDVYSERAADGDAYPQSIGARAVLARAGYAVTLDYRRNVYLTASAGPGTLTHYARIEGGSGTRAPFLARDSSFEARIERPLADRTLWAGIGFVRTWTNYAYPSLTGLGVGVEHRAHRNAGLRAFGSAFYYPCAAGRYAAEDDPSRTLTAAFRILKLDYGFVLHGRSSRLYFVAGYANEFRRANGVRADIRFIRSDAYAAIGAHI